tara:strand:+ start:140 stop:568 length:429 start_codon:yes stop_codon:yes gene_type:complete
LEDSKLTPEENNSKKSTPEINEENSLNDFSSDINQENNSKESSPKINEELKKEEKLKAFTEFLDKASNQDVSEQKSALNLEEQLNNKNSIFRRFLNNGFDGISTNPNYKMLALLIILLINLSLFFVIGNMGKVFLKNAGIMG